MNFIINTTIDNLSSTVGKPCIALVGKVFDKIRMDFQRNTIMIKQEKSIIKTMAGLISQGRFSFAEVDLIREDTLF